MGTLQERVILRRHNPAKTKHENQILYSTLFKPVNPRMSGEELFSCFITQCTRDGTFSNGGTS